MHALAGDRGDVHHRTLGGDEFVHQSARQHDGREEIDLKHRLPVVFGGLDGVEAGATRLLRADRRVVDHRVKA